MKKHILLLIASIFVSLLLIEIIFRLLNYPKNLKDIFHRKDIIWTLDHVSLNSYGYRDNEYLREKQTDVFRVYVIGDSYTYGWLIDNPEDTFSAIIEKELQGKLNKKIEVINAASPGFTMKEIAKRFIEEGKYFYPDLVIVGINDDEANVSNHYVPAADSSFPKFTKSSKLYQATLGNYFAAKSESINHEYISSIYSNQSSKDWEEFSDYLLKMQKEATTIHAKMAILLFPHIHANNPYKENDFVDYNRKLKEFAEQREMFFIDPSSEFYSYPKREDLVINPIDPHPTVQANRIFADKILSSFDFSGYTKDLKSYIPLKRTIVVDEKNKTIGSFHKIFSISSNVNSYPWVYFETRNSMNTQSFPLIGSEFRKTSFHADYLETAKSFTHSGLPGAVVTYHMRPEKNGEITFPENLYGYEVIGISYIQGLLVQPTGETKGEYINPTIISRKDGSWIVKFNQTQDFKIYTLNLKVGVRQIDLDEKGEVVSVMQTKKLSQKVSEKSRSIQFDWDGEIGSYITFQDFDGTSFNYAIVDGEVKKVKSIDKIDGKLILEFFEVISKDSEIDFYMSAKYDFSPTEKLQIDLE